MSLSIGIIGLPNVGKSTLFKALTQKLVDISNYPFTTIEPNIGIVEVPDKRLIALHSLSHSKKVVPAFIKFVDIAGLVKGANKGQGLGNQFLAEIREVDLIIHLIRCFENPNVAHLEKTIDPLRDIEIIRTELKLKDLETIEKRIEKIQEKAKSGNKEIVNELEILKEIKHLLNQDNIYDKIITKTKDENKIKIINSLQLLTLKPVIFLFNSDEEVLNFELEQKVKKEGYKYLVANLAQELESSFLSPEEREELDIKDLKLSLLIKKCYEMLRLITFFTIAGSNETRAWSIKDGSQLIQAAGLIHTDFEQKFIRAEVINWKDLIEVGGWSEAKAKGLVRVEGREYLVQEGDVMEVKHG